MKPLEDRDQTFKPQSSALFRMVLVGPPAAGKGTLARRLSKKFAIPAISTGAIIREEKLKGTALGQEAAKWTSTGKLFPDTLALQVVREWLLVHDSQFIFDGFPRTLSQAKSLDAELERRGTPLGIVFSLKISVEEIERRIQNRLTCERCGATFQKDGLVVGSVCPECGTRIAHRDDDTPTILQMRLSQHSELTNPILEYYDQQRKLVPVACDAGSDAAFAEICQIIEGRVRNESAT